MIILSNCFTETVDEGCIKVANSLAKRIKQKFPETTILSYERESKHSDIHMNLNKMLLNMELFRFIRKKKETVVYIPFTTNTLASIIRTWLLSVYSKKNVVVIFAGSFDMNFLGKFLLKKSRAKVVALAKEAFDTYQSIVGDKAIYLKAGVDTKQFVPVDEDKKKMLREKYGVPQGKKVVLHVGHMEQGRNVIQLTKISKEFQVYLILSTTTEMIRDPELRKKLEAEENITILDQYLPNIEEIYQMSDVYFFPVMQKGNCIDIPLSVMEAAACNLPVVLTEYGELKEFKNEKGCFFLESFEEKEINAKIREAINAEQYDNRSLAKKYDWDFALETFMNNSS